MRYTNLAQASMCCTKGCKNGEIKAFICTLCYYDNGSSNASAIACVKKDCAEMEMDVMPKLVGDNEEIEAPMRFRSAIAKILKIHNSPNTINPQDIEETSGAPTL